MELDKRLCINLVTTGMNPKMHSIVHLTAWWMLPPPFGDKLFTCMVEPHPQRKTDPDHMAAFGPNYAWVTKPCNPIYRDAIVYTDVWALFMNYLKSTWGSYGLNGLILVASNLEGYPKMSSKLAVEFMYYALYNIYVRERGPEYSWEKEFPFIFEEEEFPFILE